MPRTVQKIQLSAGETGTTWAGQEAGSPQARVPRRSLLSSSGMNVAVCRSGLVSGVLRCQEAGRTLVLAGRPFTKAPFPAARPLLRICLCEHLLCAFQDTAGPNA